jgi:hypothetical protein
VSLWGFSSRLKIWRENNPEKRRQIIKTLGVVGLQKRKRSVIILHKTITTNATIYV